MGEFKKGIREGNIDRGIFKALNSCQACGKI